VTDSEADGRRMYVEPIWKRH